MASLRELIHSCDLFRPTTVKGTTGQTKPSPPGTATTSAIPCLLQAGYTKRIKELFGADVACDGVVYFADGQDVRPGVQQTSGLNDRLQITARGVLTEWLVVGVRAIEQARGGYVVAAVKRSGT